MSAQEKPLIWIAGDHAAVDLKKNLIQSLSQFRWKDLGPHSADSMDYPDTASLVAGAVSRGEARQGILICGTGIGMSIAANKFARVRAALVQTTDEARLSREHNDSNILCLGAKIVTVAEAEKIVRVWMETPFSNEERHIRRIKKISGLEK